MSSFILPLAEGGEPHGAKRGGRGSVRRVQNCSRVIRTRNVFPTTGGNSARFDHRWISVRDGLLPTVHHADMPRTSCSRCPTPVVAVLPGFISCHESQRNAASGNYGHAGGGFV